MDSNDKLNTINEFYSNEISLGPYEVPGGKFKYYAMGTLSYHFINSLINNNHPIITNNVFLPKYTDHKIYKTDNNLNYNSNMIKMKNITIINPPEYTKTYKKLHKTNSYHLNIPNYIYDLFTKFNSCYSFKRFIFLNLFLISTDNNNNIIFQHGNILILDTFNKTIERFDPHGGSTFIDLNSKKRIKNLKRIYKQELIDEILRNKFTNILPNYKYLNLSITCPYIGPQLKVDMYKGLCMTWCLMYFLLRIYNPNVSMSDINKYLIINDYKTILYNILHFQKYVIDYLRNQ